MTMKTLNIAFQIHNIIQMEAFKYVRQSSKNHATAWQDLKMEDGTDT